MDEETNKAKVFGWMLAESNKAQKTDGWITRIYPRMKEELGLDDHQISKETRELVSEGKVIREGIGVSTRWKAVEAEEAPVSEEVLQPPVSEPKEEEAPTPIQPVRTPDEDLIERIDQEIQKLGERIVILRQDKEIIQNAESARERATKLPPITEGEAS